MPNANCNRSCWIAAAGLGLLVWILAGTGPLAWFEALFLALIATGLFGVFLVWLVCGGEPAHDASAWQPAAPLAAATPRAEPQDAQPVSKPSSPPPAAHKPEPAPSAAPKGDPVKPAGAGRPETQAGAAAAPDAADDLKKIKGVGPKLEELLQANGIRRFAQIAAWDEAEMDRFAELIGRMGGRIRSDDWVGQARLLAAGGDTEFSKRVDEGNVY